ncbi:hypothetical protein HNE05_08125 [Aquipseudomonas campi]|uniref:Uncharacterized protein n=1 Tax=Aquipseudomonas campi TaxID=2731681 RepID=A0A6M8F7R3_9GAMM|nr:hypothetical protein [Pseudomonas campi]QKE63331.1 hypothetical protein HNE05_08125 [Pseudomonas campi]
MNYIDGQTAMVGDEVLIDGRHKGIVVACIDSGQYTAQYPQSEWAYLVEGTLIDTDFGGLIHYKNSANESIALVKRGVNL